jgi:hypothetical protein
LGGIPGEKLDGEGLVLPPLLLVEFFQSFQLDERFRALAKALVEKT